MDSSILMIYVVGSGPAGVSCASALLEQGLEVTLVDAGIDIEPERREVVERLGGGRYEDWQVEDLAAIRENTQPTARGIPDKRIFGSDFPFRDALERLSCDRRNVDAGPSLARGGFSNVWGAVSAPYPDADIADWPVSTKELAPHYKAALGLTHLAATHDALESFLPLYATDNQPLEPSRQAASFLSDCGQNRESLVAEGLHIGRSRLAVRVGPSNRDPGCVYCGLCLYGCPYGLIYNSQSTLAKLRTSPRFHYLPDVVVEKLEERGGEVLIIGRSLSGTQQVQFRAERVYLACGVYATTKILLSSLEVYDEPVTIRDSQYFLLPLLRYRGTPGVESEALHTLAQAFIELCDPAVTPHTVHMEVFTYNDLLFGAAAGRLGALAAILRLPIREFVRRVLVAQCFLHSDVSPTIEASLVRAGDGSSRELLVLEGRSRPETGEVIGRVWRKLLRHRRDLRAVPVPPLIEIGLPGRGYHSGGSFPMRVESERLASDVWGRPFGMQRVHAVDATVLPTIPAPTITLPVMANAHRIGSGYHET